MVWPQILNIYGHAKIKDRIMIMERMNFYSSLASVQYVEFLESECVMTGDSIIDRKNIFLEP